MLTYALRSACAKAARTAAATPSRAAADTFTPRRRACSASESSSVKVVRVDAIARDASTICYLLSGAACRRFVLNQVVVLIDAGLVSQTKDAQRRPCHLDAEVLDLMTGWIEQRRREAEERYQRLDEVLAELQETDEQDDRTDEGVA